MMRNLLYSLLFLLAGSWALTSCSSKGPDPAAIAAQAAKGYYDQLLEGRYDDFVDAQYRPDSIPSAYRAQLIANAKMYIGEQKEKHQGLTRVTVSRAAADTMHHTADVYMVFHYGDSTHEEVLVPMVEKKGVWYRR